MCDRVKGRAMK